MKKLSEILRKQKIKVTPQRLLVYRALMRPCAHLSVEEVYKKVKKDIPSIALATVYSILQGFQKKGLVTEIKIDFEKSLFEMHKNGHHHFFCQKCEEILDVDIAHPCLELQQKKVNGHLIEEFHGYFYGVCLDCQKRLRKHKCKV